MKIRKSMIFALKETWKMEVCIRILNSAIGSVKESDLVSSILSSSVSPRIVHDCLAILVEIGLMHLDRLGKIYMTTERGKEFLTMFEEIWEAIQMEEHGAGPLYFHSRTEA
jgi:predicted transcriptional regulator